MFTQHLSDLVIQDLVTRANRAQSVDVVRHLERCELCQSRIMDLIALLTLPKDKLIRC